MAQSLPGREGREGQEPSFTWKNGVLPKTPCLAPKMTGQLTTEKHGSCFVTILFLLPLAWGAVTAFVVAACQVASWADAHPEPTDSDVGQAAA
jgi:hypothetical protein